MFLANRYPGAPGQIEMLNFFGIIFGNSIIIYSDYNTRSDRGDSYVKFCKLINVLAISLLLGNASAALAAEQSKTDEASKSDEQKTTEEPVAKSGTAVTAQSDSNADELAKKLSNPISSLISVPIQYNYARTFGDDGYRNLVNIQPVIPMSISKDWNLITRIIVPVVQQKDVQPNRTQFGLGDTTPSFFFSPKAPSSSGLIWGIGPAALIPTGTDGIGANTWALGPSIVLLKQQGPWTYGVLVNQLWNIGGEADISSMFLQPFLAKGLGKGRTLSVNSESTYNWKTHDWTVPINLAYSKVTKWGKQLVSNQIGAGLYATSPSGGPEWQLRYALTLLFPK